MCDYFFCKKSYPLIELFKGGVFLFSGIVSFYYFEFREFFFVIVFIKINFILIAIEGLLIIISAFKVIFNNYKLFIIDKYGVEILMHGFNKKILWKELTSISEFENYIEINFKEEKHITLPFKFLLFSKHFYKNRYRIYSNQLGINQITILKSLRKFKN